MALFSDLISNIKGLFWEQINLDGYVFDAYLRMSNQSSLVITDHPVETGSPISDNAYFTPRVFTFEIGMTDTAQGKVFGQFGFLDRAVTAYKLLEDWQISRKIITLNGKYGFYNNIMVKDLVTNDDYTTSNGMKATVTLREIIGTSSQLVKVSAASWFTGSSNRGNQNTLSPSRDVSSLVESGLLEGS